MLVFILVFAFVFGVVIASFFGSLTYRLETNKKYLKKKRSFCPDCKHSLSALDLVPLVSFLASKGKCRYCNRSISPAYPVSELAVGLLWSVFAWGLWSSAFIWDERNLLLIFALLLVLSFLMVTDIFYYVLPHELNLAALLLLVLILNFDFSLSRLLGAAVAVGFFIFLWLITKFKGIGLGDVGLAVWFGYGLAAPVVFVALMASFIYGAIIGVFLMLSGKKGLKQAVPFGPFLIFGFVTAWFWGEQILKWYVGRLWG